MQNNLDLLQNELNAHIQTSNALIDLLPSINEASQMTIDCLKNGGKILICGNGGSAGDSQHFAAELTGRYKRERKGLSAIALTTDSSALSAIGNDYGFDFIFSRQVEALCKNGDIIFGISTSGNSKNVALAFDKAHEIGASCIFLGGKDGGILKNKADLNLIIGSDTPRIQEMHILIIHMICELTEREFAKQNH
ncbi:MAG: D-sedoheptulose 7-phosphate isomerase [Helicobacter sp.]|nr:D-sedoheptulose 7-phosphate isomerase [Helicobacter sp.]